MTRDDVKKLLFVMTNTYSNFRPVNMSQTVDTWFSIIGDVEYMDMAVALKQFIRTDTSGFAPTPGQLLSTAAAIQDPLTEGEAWALVRRAMRRCNSYNRAEDRKAFEELPETVQRAIGSVGVLSDWSVTDSGIVQSYFSKNYRNAQEVEKRYELMSPDVKALIAERREQIGVNK